MERRDSISECAVDEGAVPARINARRAAMEKGEIRMFAASIVLSSVKFSVGVEASRENIRKAKGAIFATSQDTSMFEIALLPSTSSGSVTVLLQGLF